MTILYHLDGDGGFTCGDTETGLTAYAYASSTHATRAKRQPAAVAADMLRNEIGSSAGLRTQENDFGRRVREQDAYAMALLRKHGTAVADAPVTVEPTPHGLQMVIPGAEARLPPTFQGRPKKTDARQDTLF